MTRLTSRSFAILSGVAFVGGLGIAAIATAQSGGYEQEREQALERPDDRQQALEMGDQRQREIERGPDRNVEDPSHRQDDLELGDQRQEDLEGD